jgi:hypothetical protein
MQIKTHTPIDSIIENSTILSDGVTFNICPTSNMVVFHIQFRHSRVKPKREQTPQSGRRLTHNTLELRIKGLRPKPRSGFKRLLLGSMHHTL